MRIVGDLKMRIDYKCHVCGAIEEGTTFSAEVDAHSPREFADAISRIERTQRLARNMPIGWASYLYEGKYAFKCPKDVT